MPLRLCLLGGQRSGKDTAAEYLASQWGFRRIALADAVKAIAGEYFGMTDKDRALLQAIGMKGREIDQEVWLKYLWRKVSSVDWAGSRVVVTDARLKDEVAFLQPKDFHMLRIHASKEVRSKRPGYDAALDHHITEHDLDDYECETVVNERTIPELHGDLRLIVQRLRLGKYPALPR